MTDYLEQQLDHANALLEQVRKMERSGSGMLGEQDRSLEAPEGEEQTSAEVREEVDALKKQVNQMEERVDDGGLALETAQDMRKKSVNPEMKTADEARTPPQEEPLEAEGQDGGSPAAGTNEERARDQSPLAARLEELDRAVSAMAAAPGGGWNGSIQWSGGSGRDGYPVSLQAPQSLSDYPVVTGTAAEGWNSPGGAGAPVATAEQNWAEQADRVFRRDSRRYDGGFYLY